MPDEFTPCRDFASYLERWSQLHDGIDPTGNRLIHGWLRIAYVLAKPLVAVRLTPNAVTVIALLISVCVPVAAWFGVANGTVSWLWVATWLVPAAGLLDSLDGAVAMIRGRTSCFGSVLDSVCDRVSEAAIAAALLIVGANIAWVVAAIVAGFVLEYGRARVRALDPGWDPPLTVAERPTRLIIYGVFLGLAALSPYGVAAETWANWGAILGTIVAIIGVGQMLFAVKRQLQPRN